MKVAKRCCGLRLFATLTNPMHSGLLLSGSVQLASCSLAIEFTVVQSVTATVPTGDYLEPHMTVVFSMRTGATLLGVQPLRCKGTTLYMHPPPPDIYMYVML